MDAYERTSMKKITPMKTITEAKRIVFQTYIHEDGPCRWFWGCVTSPPREIEFGPFVTEQGAQVHMNANPDKWHSDVFITKYAKWPSEEMS